MCQHDNTIESAIAILHGITSKQLVLLGIHDEMVNQSKNIVQTQAAEELQCKIIEEVEWQCVEIAWYYEEAGSHPMNRRELQGGDRKKMYLGDTAHGRREGAPAHGMLYGAVEN